MVFVGWRGQDGVVACGVEAENYFGAWSSFNAEAVGADGHATVGSDLEGRADAPNLGPPRAAGGWAQHGALFFFGQFPGALRGHAQFAMGFLGVVMEAQSVDMRVGHFELSDLFAGEIGRQSALPELVFTLDFSFGLGCWGIQEANVVEFERRAELGQGLGILGEKDGMVIDVNLQGATVAQERGGQEIKVGQQEFAAIDFGTDEHAATIVEHIEHGKGQRRRGKPAMGRSIQLPEFTDLGALPAAHWSVRAFGGSGMGEAVLHGPAADLGAIELEGVQAQSFGGSEAVRTRRGVQQALFEEVCDGLGPGGGVVSPGGSREPRIGFLARAGPEVIGGERIKAAERNAELGRAFGGRQGALPEGDQHMPNKSGRVAIG